MPCYHPLTAYQTEGSRKLVFNERETRNDHVVKTLSLPCGRCIGCRLERSRQWAMRCMHEASLHEYNCFSTFTYNNENLPRRGVLQHEDFQKFMKRLRWHFKFRIGYYMCGEYGPKTWRPHYHAILFGLDFADKKFWRTSDSGHPCYRSATLESLWPLGHCELGACTFESAAYVARYCVQKVVGKDAKAHYRREDGDGEFYLPPEYNRMSLNPAVAKEWYKRFGRDIYRHDEVAVQGVLVKPPKYYDRCFKEDDPDRFEEVKYLRELAARRNYQDNVPERLFSKEICASARLSKLPRGVIE